MTTIFEITPNKPSWRDDWVRATYNNAPFHCEANTREGGRRIVEHQFPKKEYPYAEDMGRAAREFSIRAYCIVYSRDDDDLYRTDYRKVRDRLIDALETEGPGILQLSTQPPQTVVVTKYRMTEEERFGGFCTFDITFVEYGIDPLFDPGQEDTQATLAKASQNVRDQVQRSLAPPSPSIGTATVDA
ncbi:prophage DNA circulation protein [Bradyrhizobium barranii subsp. barranii]|uniref:DNA circularization N-terminal domain-containing protein n=1 Tax=Bradyrhizobium barranii subsp. barranii TaxID=2823807 RepID=A0A939MM05_9BRAD|nr:DNA circularization N-terminal domain-containing protein [Bradyrhizobium barranii]UEM11971.1 DNA circularization N-terminal domain-containing protein [Bradyrhizobium barranii subsp. barranii]